MKEVKSFRFKNEKMERNRNELFALPQKLSPKFRAKSRVEVVKLLLDDYKEGIEECSKKPENF